MTDEELIAWVRNGFGNAAADRWSALVKENAELTEVLDMQWKADMRAIKMWQEAHPGNDLVWPDGAKLTVWLMERVDALKGERDRQYDENVNRIHQQALAEARAERLEAALRVIADDDGAGTWQGNHARAALKGEDHE